MKKAPPGDAIIINRLADSTKKTVKMTSSNLTLFLPVISL